MKLTSKEFLQRQLDMGIGPHNPEFVKLAEKTADQLSDYKGLSIIDFGAGTGVYSNVLHQRGFDVTAQDIDKGHRDFMKEIYPNPKVIARPKKSDLMLFIEVAEHMTDDEIFDVIEKIEPNYILFSSTSQKTDFDEEWNHINIKEQNDWIDFWSFLGYRKIKNLKYPTAWTMLFEKI